MMIEDNTEDVPYWTVKDAAHYSRLTAQTIYNAVGDGQLQHRRICAGRSIRLRKEWVDTWLARSRPRRRAPRQGSLWEASRDAAVNVAMSACTTGK